MDLISKVITACTVWMGIAVAAPAIWDGTADVSWYTSSAQAYNLTTAEQLAGLAKLVNQGTSSFEGKTITLGADIFLNDTAGADAGTWASVPHTEWTPIGTSSRPFKGEFDGIAGKKNRKIYGLYVNNATKDYVGLFGYTSNVKISNLDVLVGRITAKDNVGALVGYAVGGSLTNVHSEVKVTGNNHVGGLVGYFTGNLSASSVKENVTGQDSVGGLIGITTGSVSGTAKAKSYFVGNVTGRISVGGIVGAGSSITLSYADGIVKGDSSYVGGIAGYVTGNIDSTYHIGGDVSGASYVGGVVGQTTSSVKKSYSEGNVTGTSSYVGGLVGYGVSVGSSKHTKGDVNGAGYVGGLIGQVSSSVTNSYSEGNVTGTIYVGGLIGNGALITASSAKGDINGQNYVGGLAGQTTSSVNNSSSEGDVTGQGNYVGGLIGYAKKNIYSSSHNGGNVSGSSYIGGLVGKIDSAVTISTSRGDVTGQGNYVGGLIGLSYYHYSGTSNETVMTAQNSFAIGNVKGKGYVGGLIGLDSIYSSSNGTKNLVKRISNSHSVGNVIGKDKYVGGVIGKSNYGRCSFSCSDKNISLQTLSSYHKGSIESDSSYVGGVAGYASGIIDSTYHIDGNVSGNGYVGGLVGYVSSTVSNSYSEGNVTGASSYVGGLIGLSYYYYSSDSSAITIMTAQNSYATGNVSGKGYVGGLIGLDSIYISYRPSSDTKTLVKKISNSHSVGNVVGKDKYVGGVLGKSNYGYYSSSYSSNISLQMLSSYHKGSVESTSYYVGGVAGYVSGDVDSTYHVDGNVNGSGYVGGLIGQASSSVKNSYSEGNVMGTSNYVGGLIGNGVSVNSSNHAKGEVSGSNYIGGLIGYASSAVKNSYSEGDVTGTGNYVGGLIGLSYYYCSCSSDITIMTAQNSYAVGNVSGKGYVGGLVGLDSAYRSSNYLRTLVKKISNSHSVGNVIGKGNYVGGIIGKSNDESSNTNLQMLSSYHKGSVESASYYVGGVAGYVSGDVDSVYHVDGDVSGYGHVGGLVGYATSSVKNSYSEGNVTGTSSYVGGLVGSSVSISNSHSEGNVIGSLDYVGGIAGSSGKIRNSYAEAKYVRGRNIVGGLAGYVTDSIDVSYFEGDSVTGINKIGGLVGYAEKTVDSSYSTAHVKGDDEVGGLAGSAYGDVSNSYAIGNVVGDVEHSSAGNDNLGGLVGYQYSGSVSKSMALGNVSGTTKLGGLVGRFDGTKISLSYANGNVTGDYYGDPADENGNFYIGGLVGYAKGALEETYASGVVKGIEDEPVYTGCVVGYVNGSLSVTKSYYDKTKCGLGIDGGENAASVSGTPDKTTAEMQTQSTFEDWDFTDTWKIMENTYPFLQIYSNSLTNAVVTTQSFEGINYDGTAKTPLVTSVTLFGETLEYETEYTIAYANNVNAGTASINVCGVQPYGGCKVINFEIAGIAVKPTIAAIENVTYTGHAQTPEIKVYNGETLLAATDYAVEYKDNVNSGTATVVVTMKGNYGGSASKTFKIEKATPVISQNPKASDVVVGETLASSVLTGGYANVDGEFVWNTPSTKPSLENDGYAVVFVPNDTNYTKSAEIIVPIKVLDVVYVAVHAGTVTLDSTVLVKGAEYTLPEVPEKTGYDFKGLYKGKSEVGKVGDKIAITENTVIDAVYQAKMFMVTFLNGSVKLQTAEVAYGEMPEYIGDVPTKTATAQYAYLFKEWSPELTTVTEAANYTAVFDSVVNKYVITFANGVETLQSDSVLYGDLPEYKGTVVPTKSSTEEYDYVFKGWNPTIAFVTGVATYTAVFDSSLRKYTVTFKNGTTTMQTSDVVYGSKPSYTGITPTKTATEKYDYVFNGWSPAITSVTGAATYTAVFDSTFHKYAITFKNGTTTLQTIDVAYGSTPSYTGTTPKKSSTDKYSYIFKEWSPELKTVTGATSYTAVFDSVVNKYVITFANGAETLQSDSVLYGNLPEYKGAKTPSKVSTDKYSYTFKGWNPTIASVTGAATYTAVFDSTLRKYTVTFKNGTTTLQTSDVAYGTKPSYTGETPTKSATDKYTYTFKGWSPSLASVTGVSTYTAVFDSTLRKYTITFKNGTTTLQTSDVAYGSKPSYTGSTPTKKATNKYTYKFKGWDPSIVAVTKAATYQAVFDSSSVTGIADGHFASLNVTVSIVSRTIQISAAPKNSTYAILDMQGRVLLRGRVESANFNIAMPSAGSYFVRVGNVTRKVQVK